MQNKDHEQQNPMLLSDNVTDKTIITDRHDYKNRIMT